MKAGNQQNAPQGGGKGGQRGGGGMQNPQQYQKNFEKNFGGFLDQRGGGPQQPFMGVQQPAGGLGGLAGKGASNPYTIDSRPMPLVQKPYMGEPMMPMTQVKPPMPGMTGIGDAMTLPMRDPALMTQAQAVQFPSYAQPYMQGALDQGMPPQLLQQLMSMQQQAQMAQVPPQAQTLPPMPMTAPQPVREEDERMKAMRGIQQMANQRRGR